MRGYYHFSVNRSYKHLAVVFGVILLPLVGLFIFSKFSGVPFGISIFDLSISAWRLAVAFVVATVIAWIFVVVLVRGKTEDASLALFDVFQSLPTFTILPIAVRFLGNGEVTIICFLIITIIWPIIFSIISSIKQADRSWHDAVKISRIKGFHYIRFYLLPVTLPGIITGAIIGLGNGWEALIATELLVNTSSGLGPFFQNFSSSSTITLFGVLIFLSVIFVINKFIWLPLLDKSHQLMEQ